MVLLLAACQPVTFGSPGAQIGNDLDPANCTASQPVPTAPCGPQPMLWAAINGPYASIQDGDPYATRCAQGGGSGTGCTATNPDYRSSGYAYVIEVGAGDVGMPLTLQGYDVGTYTRRVGSSASSAPARTMTLTLTSGSRNITAVAGVPFSAADVGQPVTIGCIPACLPANATIQTVVNATTATLSGNAAATGAKVATVGWDCNTSKAPFNVSTYIGMGGNNCQTGENDTGQNFDVQVFDNDGSGNVSYSTPLDECHFSESADDLAAAQASVKNAWIDLCTFTPTKKGAYALRVRNSGIGGLSDVGSGYNSYALKVIGGQATRLHAIGDQSMFVIPAASTATAYLIDVPAANAGKKLVVDLYDVGDTAGSSPATIQVLAPPGGVPGPVPAGTGATVPAAGIATSCTYNATGSLTFGPATPDVAATCAATTHTSGFNEYNGKWLRFEITLDTAYTCSTDCWWTLHWDWGASGLPTDRLTYTAKVVG